MLSIQRAAALFAALCLTPLLTGLLVACASNGSSASNAAGSSTKTAGTITFRDYTENSTLKLVSDSQLIAQGTEGDTYEERRLHFYSAEQTDAAAKSCHDDAIAGLLQAFELGGLEKDAVDGPAPETGAERDNSIEIMIDGRTRHVMKSSTQDLRAFVDFMQTFIEVYNLYEGRNNVGGNIEFKQPKLSTRARRSN